MTNSFGPVQSGLTFELDAPSPSHASGTLRTVQIAPSSDFAGCVTIVGRADDGLSWLPVPYRRVAAAGLASDLAYSSDPIASASIVQVPVGFSVGLLVSCTAGSCSYAVI